MRNRLCLALCLAVSTVGACTQVFDAVTTADCVPGSADPNCGPTGWPTADHGANSDPWLVTHNQVINVMKPNVLVLNFENGVSSTITQATAQSRADALGVGSEYHGYQDSAALQFLKYHILPIVDLTNDNPSNPQAPLGWPNVSSTLLPTTAAGAFDPSQLFSDQFSSNYGYPDSKSSSGFLSLCDLFEQGIVNEVWIQDGESPPRRAPLYAESKQPYGANGQAIAGSFDCVGGGSVTACIDNPCSVTVRMGHLDPAGGSDTEDPSCDLGVWGWGLEGMWDALPAFQTDADAFMNRDFDTRFGVIFNGWSAICGTAGDPTPCVSYPSPTSATSTPGDATTWNIDQFYQGCGSSQFPPNATFRDDFEQTVSIESRCEHFGLGDAGNGGDTYQLFNPDTVATLNQTYPAQKCGGGWQIYWRQSMPGYQNQAKAFDGSPMKNWWPILFY